MEEVVLHFGQISSEAPEQLNSPVASTPYTITSLSTPQKRQLPFSEDSPHQKIRKLAGDNFLRAANRQQINFDRQKGAMKNDHVAGDTVGVRIAKVDRTNISMRFLSCKVLEKTNGKFRLYSSSGVLNTAFAHTDLHE